MVLPGTPLLEVTLMSDQDVMLTLDGQVGFALKRADIVEIRRAAARTRLLRGPHKDFFSVLRTKLKWGER
jgi:NAD+ kinase